MSELIEASLRFPTVIFTIGLGIALFYWAFVLLGALDIDLLGAGDAGDAGKGLGDLVGAGKGVGDVAGAGKAIGDVAGAGKAVGDVAGAGKAVGDAAVGAKAGIKTLAASAGDDGGFLGLGLTRVPMTISLSLVLLIAWCVSLLTMYYGTHAFGDAVWLAPATLVLAGVVALPTTSLLIKPLVPVFAIKEGKSNRDYIGHLCVVTTGHVDDNFGQANIEDGGTVLIISVRSDRKGLQRGHKALIVDFDSARNAYIVEPAGELADISET